MARKTRQTAKPTFAPFRPQPCPSDSSAAPASDATTLAELISLLTPNTRFLHACCAGATCPTDEEITKIRVGDLVKVRFTAPIANERMWVRVTARDGEQFTGILDNIPQLTPNLQWGDVVTFTAQEIVALNS